MQKQNLLILGAGQYGAVAKETAQAMDCFGRIAACAPAYQGYFLCPWKQGFQMLEGSHSLSGESKSSCYKRHIDPKQITRGNSA